MPEELNAADHLDEDVERLTAQVFRLRARCRRALATKRVEEIKELKAFVTSLIGQLSFQEYEP